MVPAIANPELEMTAGQNIASSFFTLRQVADNYALLYVLVFPVRSFGFVSLVSVRHEPGAASRGTVIQTYSCSLITSLLSR